MTDKGKGKCQQYFNDVVRTYTGEACLLWPFGRSRRGDARMAVGRKLKQAARVLCEIEHGPPPTPEHHAAHSCGNGHLGCVNRYHLSWKTPLENNADMLVHGTRIAGEKNHKAKITAGDAADIRRLRGSMSQQKIAEKYGLKQAAVSKIQLGATWKHLGSIEKRD
jgi:hypothetical protein